MRHQFDVVMGVKSHRHLWQPKYLTMTTCRPSFRMSIADISADRQTETQRKREREWENVSGRQRMKMFRFHARISLPNCHRSRSLNRCCNHCVAPHISHAIPFVCVKEYVKYRERERNVNNLSAYKYFDTYSVSQVAELCETASKQQQQQQQRTVNSEHCTDSFCLPPNTNKRTTQAKPCTFSVGALMIR